MGEEKSQPTKCVQRSKYQYMYCFPIEDAIKPEQACPVCRKIVTPQEGERSQYLSDVGGYALCAPAYPPGPFAP